MGNVKFIHRMELSILLERGPVQLAVTRDVVSCQGSRNRVSHLVHFGNTFLHDYSVWKILQISYSVRYAHGEFRANIICTLKRCWWGRVRLTETDLDEAFFTHEPPIKDLNRAQLFTRFLYF
jgi:hypothetical protein